MHQLSQRVLLEYLYYSDARHAAFLQPNDGLGM